MRKCSIPRPLDFVSFEIGKFKVLKHLPWTFWFIKCVYKMHHTPWPDRSHAMNILIITKVKLTNYFRNGNLTHLTIKTAIFKKLSKVYFLMVNGPLTPNITSICENSDQWLEKEIYIRKNIKRCLLKA